MANFRHDKINSAMLRSKQDLAIRYVDTDEQLDNLRTDYNLMKQSIIELYGSTGIELVQNNMRRILGKQEERIKLVTKK